MTKLSKTIDPDPNEEIDLMRDDLSDPFEALLFDRENGGV